MIEASSLKTLESEIDKFSEDSDFQQICTDLITLIKDFPKIFDVSSRENLETVINQQLFSARSQELYEEYDCEQISLKKADNLTEYQATRIHPYVEPLLKVDTIYNLYTPEITVSSKIPHGCLDMRNVMSKPFCIENLYYSKPVPVDEATLDEFNQNTGNNVKKADVYLSRKALKEVNSFVLAFAVAEKIIMMRGQHKPETEEGRKLLAHELTHVAQNQNKEFVDHRTREELEEEAEANERTAESIQDPLVTRKVEGKDVVLPASMWHEVSQKLFRELRRWIHYEKFILPPDEYELLVKKYEYFMKYMSRKYRW